LSTAGDKTQPQVKRPSGLALLYKQHWHVEFTHFPVSFFMGSALFMVLHFVSYANRNAYELVAYILLISGMVMMWPTTLTGWNTWKGHYHGARAKIFLYKIRTAFGMIALSIFLVIWRAVLFPSVDTVWFYMYAAGIFLLFVGTAIEGYFGGQLNHH
jgi:hypothetical protein